MPTARLTPILGLLSIIYKRRMALCRLHLLLTFNRGWPTTRPALTSCRRRARCLTSCTTSPKRAFNYPFWVQLDSHKNLGIGVLFTSDSLRFCIAKFRRGGGGSMRTSGWGVSVRYCTWLNAAWRRTLGLKRGLFVIRLGPTEEQTTWLSSMVCEMGSLVLSEAGGSSYFGRAKNFQRSLDHPRAI
jgi:hypothetical protein